eukprot:scaffold283900_cov32-Tisochrysis_lutea.AAC.2
MAAPTVLLLALVASVSGTSVDGAARPRSDRSHRPLLLAEVTDPHSTPGYLCVVGSVNMDVIVEVDRLPRRDETVASRATEGVKYVPGGKGANQAVAAARLSQGTPTGVRFVCQFGSDVHASILEDALVSCGVDISASGRVDCQSGQGYVFLEPDGAASSVVVAGANAAWPNHLTPELCSLVRGASAVLLQREIPEHVNEAVAAEAVAAGVPIFQDIGGEDRPLSDAQIRRATFLMPNQSELERLTSMTIESQEGAIAAAASLQRRGARNVLVTLGAHGALLLDEAGTVTHQSASVIPGGAVVDATGAGDAFRAAFAVAMAEARPVNDALRFAASSGAIAVSRMGAVPSLPHRQECEQLCLQTQSATRISATLGGSMDQSTAHLGVRGGQRVSLRTTLAVQHAGEPHQSDGVHGLRGGDAQTSRNQCPLEFASRLNSMKDGWKPESGLTNDVLGWVAAQGRVDGLSLVDFNYPQHLAGVNLNKVGNSPRPFHMHTGPDKHAGLTAST